MQIAEQVFLSKVTRKRKPEERPAPAQARHTPRIPRPTPPVSAPLPQPYGVSHEGAEHLVAAWIAHLGDPGARVTRRSRDGGVDIESSQVICQVKNYAGTVGVTSVRELHGVRSVHAIDRLALFFTSGEYSRDAIQFADRAKIGLLRYDAARGTLTGTNGLGMHVRNAGLYRELPVGWHRDVSHPTAEYYWDGNEYTEGRSLEAPAGWYRDPNHPTIERRWNGTEYNGGRSIARLET